MIPPKVVEKLEKRLAQLKRWRYQRVQEVTLEMAETTEHFRQPPAQLDYAEFTVGDTWGQHWRTVWFRGRIDIPREHKGRRVYYRNVTHAERLLFLDGQPFAGMNPHHSEVLLTRSARGAESFSLHLEAYSGHPLPGLSPWDTKPTTHQFCDELRGEDPPLTLEASELLVERVQTSGLFYDADTLFRTARTLDGNSLRRARILDEVNGALDLLPMQWETEEELEEASKAARKKLAPLLAAKNSPTSPSVGIVGHAHIDIGWLWPVRESIRKAARSFSSVLELMEEYPDLTYQQSQPVLYQMIEDHYPDLLPRIKKRVKEGRWQPNGGMWVEPDCNVTSGESLVRQCLEGRKKTQELFGYTGDTLWLPDVFGYSAALPQILKGCGILNFVTSKINWNDTNRFPYDTFWWRGIDGTEIFTQFITTTGAFSGYNAEVIPEAVANTWNQVQQKEAQDRTLASVGFGDGGGGPTREMCEYAARMADLEGCPKTSWINVSEFLGGLREDQCERPRWVGELYLEYHRGTYTTQARTKRFNRKLEILLRQVELFHTMALPLGVSYPAEGLQRHWRTLLTNQFHDILPGTSIHAVYETAEAEYAAMEEELTLWQGTALDALGATLLPDMENHAYLVANPLSWPRTEVIVLPEDEAGAAVDADGASLPCQPLAKGVAVAVTVPALSVVPIALRQKEDGFESVFEYGSRGLETPHYSVAFDQAGKFTRLYDKKAARDVVRPGKRLNDFYTAEDMPLFWDAWDIDLYYRGTVRFEETFLGSKVIADGPLFFTLQVEYAIGRRSRLTQDITFHAKSRRIDFNTTVDWQERRTLLKVGFGLDVHSDTWRNEIQFGHVTRPMHANTSWDAARFEVCSHKWVDVSEEDYGVALLNDCKYGHDALEDMISLTLLRSPSCPDETADQGVHEFTYALLPHTGSFDAETVVREGYALNQPLVSRRLTSNESGKERLCEFCEVSNPNVIIETVKKAEADDGAVVRIYEAGRCRSEVTLTFARGLRKAVSCNLLEDEQETLKHQGKRLTLTLRPFEIQTIKVYFR